MRSWLGERLADGVGEHGFRDRLFGDHGKFGLEGLGLTLELRGVAVSVLHDGSALLFYEFLDLEFQTHGPVFESRVEHAVELPRPAFCHSSLKASSSGSTILPLAAHAPSRS